MSLLTAGAVLAASSLAACSSVAGADYAPAPGSGGEAGQLDFSGETTIKGTSDTHAPIDLGVAKHETLVHPSCSQPIGEAETCDDGRRPIPVDVTASCEADACSVEVIPSGDGATLRVTFQAPGDESIHVHATRRSGPSESWDDTVVVHFLVKKVAAGGS